VFFVIMLGMRALDDATSIERLALSCRTPLDDPLIGGADRSVSDAQRRGGNPDAVL
jgi:hypothetical protein